MILSVSVIMKQKKKKWEKEKFLNLSFHNLRARGSWGVIKMKGKKNVSIFG